MNLTKDISLPLLGIMVFTLAPYLISILSLNEVLRVPIQLMALVAVFIGLFRTPHVKHKMYDTNRVMNFLFGFYLLQLVVMFLRGYSLMDRRDYNFFGYLYTLTDPYYLLWVFTPLVVLRLYPNYNLKGLVKISYWACIVCGIMTLISIPRMLNYSQVRSIGLDSEFNSGMFLFGRIGLQFGALLLCLQYLSKIQRYVVIISFALNLLTVVLLARRGALLMSLLLVVFCIWLYFSKRGVSNKVLLVFLSISFCVLFYATNTSSIYNFIKYRGMEDSRKEVDEALLSQMEDYELWIGKGLNGKYYLPLGSVADEINGGWRYGSETGFYNLVLKGGYVLAITYILLMLVPAFLGIFRSKNLFCRAGGWYILWNVIYLYPFGVLSFDVNFFFIWMWVLQCSIPRVRNMSEGEIQATFFG